MEHQQTFDLRAYLDEKFPGLEFGGGILDQWTLGLKFDIGLQHLDRAVKILEQAFAGASELILISEDWPWASNPSRWHSLFELPGLTRSPSPLRLTSWELPRVDGDDLFTITWASLSPSDLVAERLVDAIANQDHGRTPSVRGRVYLLEPKAKLLLHMYDDRGIDVIAINAETLLPLQSRFGDLVLRVRPTAS